MKKLILILLFSTVMFSSSSYAGWTKVSETVDGYTFYVDYERIKKHDGYVYFWSLTDYLKPSPHGIFSSKTYKQGDCKLFRVKGLSYVHHKQPMGSGTGISDNPKNPEWNYPPPNSPIETILKQVCNR
jgi:hypothetical protein